MFQPTKNYHWWLFLIFLDPPLNRIYEMSCSDCFMISQRLDWYDMELSVLIGSLNKWQLPLQCSDFPVADWLTISRWLREPISDSRFDQELIVWRDHLVFLGSWMITPNTSGNLPIHLYHNYIKTSLAWQLYLWHTEWQMVTTSGYS